MTANPPSAIALEPMQPAHWNQVRAIYLEGIATANATFETSAPTWEAWDQAHLRFARIVAKTCDAIVGWAALSPVSKRAVYAGVAEVSIYVAASAQRQGIGRRLLTALVSESESQDLWTLQAGIFPENAASLGLHMHAGFRVVGTRHRIGNLNGQWRDVVLLERRSQIVGLSDAVDHPVL